MSRSKKQYVTGVVLGRFAPLHKGHQILIERMLEQHGIDRSLIIIGSSTSLNKRTPYTFEKRKAMLRTLYPDIEIIDVPDTKPELEKHDEDDIDTWLNNLREIEKHRNTEFVFYGGSKEDLQYLSQAFRTEVLVDRRAEGKEIEATHVRKALQQHDEHALKNLLDDAVLPLAKQTIPLRLNKS